MPTKTKAKAKTKAVVHKPKPKRSVKKEAPKDFVSMNQASLMKKYPQLTEGDFHRYDGEGDESVKSRIAERVGVSVEEL